MKKKTLSFIMALCLCIFFSESAMAASGAEVSLTEDGKIEYSSSFGAGEDGYVLGDVFKGMAPGETVTETISIKNNNSHTVSFFIKQDTLTKMEELNKAYGGAYSLTIKVGKNESTAVTLLDAIAGGYDLSSGASISGLSDITELNSYAYLAELANGESTNLYITIYINGEGFDSSKANDYSNRLAKIALNFRAYYDDARTGATVVKSKTTKTKAAQTGDETTYLLPVSALILFIGAAILIIVYIKKRKAE